MVLRLRIAYIPTYVVEIPVQVLCILKPWLHSIKGEIHKTITGQGHVHLPTKIVIPRSLQVTQCATKKSFLLALGNQSICPIHPNQTRVGINSGIGIELIAISIPIPELELELQAVELELELRDGIDRNWRFHFNYTNNFCYFMSLLQYQITNNEYLSMFVIVNLLEYNTKQWAVKITNFSSATPKRRKNALFVLVIQP